MLKSGKISYKINTKAKLTKLLIETAFSEIGEFAQEIVDSYKHESGWWNYEKFANFTNQYYSYRNGVFDDFRYGHSFKNMLRFDIFEMGYGALKNAKCKLENGIESIVMNGVVPMLGKLRNGVQSTTENIIQLPIVINGVLQKSKKNNSTIPLMEWGRARFLQLITVEIPLAKNAIIDGVIEFDVMQKLCGRIKHKKISDIIGKQWCKLGKEYNGHIASIEPIHFEYEDEFGHYKETITYCVNFKKIED